MCINCTIAAYARCVLEKVELKKQEYHPHTLRWRGRRPGLRTSYSGRFVKLFKFAHFKPQAFRSQAGSIIMAFRKFMGYFSHCYRKSRGSIFIGGLVGGMFLSFLMDEDDKCADRSFTNAFFVIGILHFLSNILSGAAAYASKAAEADKEVTLLERKSQLFIIFLQHLVKLAQYPMVVWLGWYVVQFNSEINGSLPSFEHIVDMLA